MFPRIKEYIQTNKKELSGCELNEYLDELQNSKLFKHSKIHIIDNPSPQINGKSFQVKTLKIDGDFRFFGDIYLYSIGNFTLNPFKILSSNQNFDAVIIRGVFHGDQFTSDPQRVKEIDRLDKLDQLDI